MLQLLLSNPIAFIILFPVLLLSIAIHEFAHAWTADKLGDPTPRSQGRVTLNPLAHLDPLGTLAIFLTGFGWGKPVEYDPYNLKNPLKDTALIALAGPASNIVLAIILSSIIQLNLISTPWLGQTILSAIFINIGLAIFNLVPIYPLDGSKILLALLPKEAAYEYDTLMHRYGLFLLLLLLFPWAGGVSPISQLISPIITGLEALLLG